MLILALLLLWVVPVGVAVLSRRLAPSHQWRSTGIALGLVVSPASLGLYGLYFVGPILGSVVGSIAAVLGMLGLALEIFHGSPGYKLAIALGLIRPGTVITGTASIPVELLDATVWSVVYGTLGWLIDRWRLHSHVVNTNAV